MKDETFTMIACSVYYDESHFRQVYDYKYDPKKNEINYALAGADFETLTAEERDLIEKVRNIMLDVPQIGCTSCRYCTPGCPMNISIPDVFRAVNTMNLYGDVFRPKAFYGGIIGQGHGRASECIACGQCESVCPQHLPIIDLLKEASDKLDA